MSLEDVIDDLIQATNVIDRVANGAIDEVVVSGAGNLITMATADRDVQAAIDAVEAAKDAGIIDIAADVSTVDIAAALALVSIQDDVDTVGEAALDFAANIQPIGSLVKSVNGTPPNDNLKIDGTVLDKFDYPEYTQIAEVYRPDSINGYSRKQTTVFPYNTRFMDICFANGKFVAVGSANGESIGAISSDGINWEYRLMGISNYPLQIGCFDFGETLGALYAFGGGFAAFSMDGLTWTAQTNYPTSIYTLVYSEYDQLFVVGGSVGYIGTSNGTNTWTTRTPAASFTGSFYGSAYGNGIYVIVGSSGEIQTSPDGTTWTHRANANGYTAAFKSAAYNNGVFVIVGEDGQIQRSADNGTTWTRASTSNGYIRDFSKVQAVPQGFLAIGDPSSGEPIEAHASLDGAKWTKIDIDNHQVDGTFVTISGIAVNKNSDEIVIFESHGSTGTYFYKTPGYFQKAAKRLGDISGVVLETDRDFYSIAYDDSVYVTVGGQGDIYSSADGITWTPRTAAASYTGSFRKIIYANSLFVAVGSSGEIQTSSDGITWTHRANGNSSTNVFYDIIFENGVFVIPDDAGVQTSSDSITWTYTAILTGATFRAVGYGDGYFLLAGTSIYISVDGINWLLRSTKTGTNPYRKIAFGNNYFLITDSVNSIYKTIDGTDPRLIYTLNTKLDEWFEIIYAEGIFILIGNDNMGNQVRTLRFSTDGENWENVWDDSIASLTSGLYEASLLGGAYLNNKLWLTGDGGVRSTDILTYDNFNLYRPDSTTVRTNTISNKLAGVTFGNDLFVAVGGDTNSEVHTSPDGITWTSKTVAGTYFNDIIFHNGYFVAVGSDGIYRTYDDLTSWVSCTFSSAPPSTDIKGIAKAPYTTGMGSSRVGYIAVGASGTIATNVNGSSLSTGWEPQTAAASYTGTFYNAIYGNGVVVAIGGTGEIQTSSDGITWTHRANANLFTGTFYAATYSEGLFIIAGTSGEIQVSIDGLAWNSVEGAEVVTFYGAFVYAGIYFLVGSNGSVQYSYNGYDWKLHESSGSGDLFGGVGNDGNVVIVGGNTGAAMTTTTNIQLDSGSEISTQKEYFGDMLGYTDTSYTGSFSAAHASDDLIVLSGQTNKIITSPDGKNWTDRDRDGSYTGVYYCSAYGNGVHVIGGYNDLQVSTDGVTWEKETWASGFVAGFHGMTFGDNLFVAGGDSAEIQTSPDGVTWTRRTADGVFANFFTDVAYGNGVYVIVGYDGEIQTSGDGITWTHRDNAGSFSDNFNGVAFKNGIFLAAGENGELQRSTDNGVTWEVITNIPAYTADFAGINTTETMFVITAYSGEIRTSVDGTIWEKIYQQGFSSVYFASAALSDVLVVAGGTGQINAADIHTIDSFDHNYQVAVPVSDSQDNFVNYTRVL